MIRGLVACLWVSIFGACLGAETPRPVKLEVEAPKAAIGLGERATLTVRLLGVNNQPVPAPRDFLIDILARLPSNTTATLTSITLPAGQSAVQVSLPPAETEGFLYIRARHPELLEGGAYLRVRGPLRPSPSPLTPAAAISPEAPAAPPVPQRAPAPILKRLPDTVAGVLRPRGGDISPSATQPAPPPPPAPPPAPYPAAAKYQLALRYSPQRAFLANGKDRVTVHAFVLPNEAADLPGFRINLYDGAGTLMPKPLLVPPGAEEGSATLTYDHVGDVKVEYLNASPAMYPAGEKELMIHFDPPIAGLDVSGSPPRISLVDTADLILTLVGEAGQPLQTHEARTVSLALESGRGALSKQEITIGAGGSEARVVFTPLWWGDVTVSARTPNLLKTAAKIEVYPPLGLAGISILGGLLGGYVFILRHPRAKRWRIPVGALTGVILFWSFLFLGLSALPRTAILNPLSIFVISVVGGWLGTGVFEPILKRLGLSESS